MKKTEFDVHPSVCMFHFQKYAMDFNESDDLLNVVSELWSSLIWYKRFIWRSSNHTLSFSLQISKYSTEFMQNCSIYLIHCTIYLTVWTVCNVYFLRISLSIFLPQILSFLTLLFSFLSCFQISYNLSTNNLPLIVKTNKRIIDPPPQLNHIWWEVVM
jgi:hypothetical protein